MAEDGPTVRPSARVAGSWWRWPGSLVGVPLLWGIWTTLQEGGCPVPLVTRHSTEPDRL